VSAQNGPQKAEKHCTFQLTTNKQDSETIMPMHRSLAVALWMLAAVGAYAAVATWADAAQSGKVPPWVLVVLFWSVALISAAIHYLSHYLADRLAVMPDTLERQYRGLATKGAAAPAVTEAATIAAPGGGAMMAEPPSWTLVALVRAAAGAATAMQRLSHALALVQDALVRGWRQLAPALGLAVGKARLLRAAGGQSVALAARLGSLIGVR
jgi:hypothetical protein